MTYSYFATKAAAESFLAAARKQGRRAFYVGVSAGEHQVRSWAD